VSPDIEVVPAPGLEEPLHYGFTDSYAEEALKGVDVIRSAVLCENMGYHAMTISCTADPGLYAAREMVKMPVVGPCEASMLLAASLGHWFGAVTLDKGHVPDIYKRAAKAGVEAKLKSVRWVDYHGGGAPPLDRFVKEVNDAVEKEGIHAVVPLCGAWVKYVDELQPKVPVPIVNPGLAAIRLAETLIKLNISHSKLAFPDPILSDELKKYYQVGEPTTNS
jgi:allantoin racemase